ncbi:hypothetical protein AB205_0068290 [Aquarana catesbeiana]|uniref:Proline-rich protein PRCC n=1 Tax=Aquarana catesbeiana TaxID=8400 RepID=A0A2G9RAN6_AQUCT|nr:hypothetical protein AB205_0068290 [Aquarana catesbeiana]
MNLPPPQGSSGMNLPPPQGSSGMNLPPPQGSSGMNLPPPQGSSGMNLPPPQGSLPPPQGSPGMNLHTPQAASSMNLPLPQAGQTMNLPPSQGSTGMNLHPSHSGPGMPPPPGSPNMNLPPRHGTSGLNLPPPQGGSGLHMPPPQNAHGMNHPPPQGGHGMNLPPPHSGLKLPPPMGGHALNLSLPQAGLGLQPAMNIPPPQLSPTSPSGAEPRMPTSKPTSHGLNLAPPESESLGNSKPKKRSEPVRISVPELRSGDVSKEGFGLSSLLPEPKNARGGDSKRTLLPYIFTKKPSDSSNESKLPKQMSKPKLTASPEVSHTPSPSAIKAAAKNAALQVTKQITQEEDEESDEEFQQGNFFSLTDSNEAAMAPDESYTYPLPPVNDDGPPGVDPGQLQNDASNAPLEFKTAAGPQQWSATSTEDYGGQEYSQYQEYNNPQAAAYYQFKRLQGKRNRGREEINFVEIKGDDQLSGNQQWLTKSLTEEKNMKSFSKKKGDQPTGQQRRKHQITYLIHQAKERELELKNAWSDNKMSRRQTQAKYGF